MLSRRPMRAWRAALLMCALLPGAARADDRAELHMFRYAGTHEQPAMGAFLDFRDIISQKLLLLAREVTEPATAADRLRVTQVRDQSGEWKEFGFDLRTLEGYWRDHGPLGVLLGRVRQLNSGFAVRSSMYLGALRGDLPQAFVDIDLPIVDEEFDTTRDSHSVVTLYALAIGTLQGPSPAAIDCGRREASVHLLNEAFVRAQDVIQDVPSLAYLRDAIQSTLERVRRAC
jgi:hypothetical protein